MLEIRLSRIGKKKKPLFRLIISEKTKDTQGDFLELLGFYNPHTKVKLVNLKKERIQYWLSKGAQTSSSVHNLLIKNGIIRGKKIKKDKAKKKTEKSLKEAEVTKVAETTKNAKTSENVEATKTTEKPEEKKSEEVKKSASGRSAEGGETAPEKPKEVKKTEASIEKPKEEQKTEDQPKAEKK